MAKFLLILACSSFFLISPVALAEDKAEQKHREAVWKLEESGPTPEGDHEYSLPDSYSAEKKCREIQSPPEPMKKAGEYGRIGWLPNEIETRSKMIDLCQNLNRGLVTRDTWWIEFHELYKEWVYGHYSCPTCMLYVSPAGKPLPTDFAAYVLLLIPNQPLEFQDSYNRDRLLLWRAFKNFGDSIGSRHSAIWLQTDDAEPSLDYDSERSKRFCDLFNLDYSKGPYLVITKQKPDLPRAAGDKVVIRLTDLTPERIVSVLNLIEQDLRRRQKIHGGRLIYEELKQRILSIAERNRELLKELAVSIGTF